MPADAQDALYDFRGAYGHYLTLAAQLLKNGATKDAILAASKVRVETLPALARLYDARLEMNRLLGRLQDRGDLTTGDFLEVARQARDAIQTEWEVDIPIVKPA